METWKTSIGYVSGDDTIIRGKSLNDLLGKHTFTEVIFLEWSDRLPTKEENALFTALLTSGIEHGISPPSVTAARIAYSGSGSFLQALAAGILSTGVYHGGAGEQAARIFQENVGKENAKERITGTDFLR